MKPSTFPVPAFADCPDTPLKRLAMMCPPWGDDFRYGVDEAVDYSPEKLAELIEKVLGS